MSWKPGDQAIIFSEICHNRHVCRLIAYIGKYPFADGVLLPAWRVDCGCGQRIKAATRVLHPIEDGREKASWSECVWKPKDIQVEESK